jgi:hypothetical protein
MDRLADVLTVLLAQSSPPYLQCEDVVDALVDQPDLSDGRRHCVPPFSPHPKVCAITVTDGQPGRNTQLYDGLARLKTIPK